MAAGVISRPVPLELAIFPNVHAEQKPKVPIPEFPVCREDALRFLFKLKRESGTKLGPDSCRHRSEMLVASALNSVPIMAAYEPFVKRPLAMYDEVSGRYLKYNVDFVLDIFIGGRRVVVEVHPLKLFDRERINKYRVFTEVYGDKYHHVLIVDAAKQELDAHTRAVDANIGKISPRRNDPIAHTIIYLGDLHRKTDQEKVEMIANALRELARGKDPPHIRKEFVVGNENAIRISRLLKHAPFSQF